MCPTKRKDSFTKAQEQFGTDVLPKDINDSYLYVSYQ